MKKKHYALIIAIAAFLVTFYNLGIAFNCISVFLNPLMENLKISNTSRSLITSFYQGGSIIVLLFVGQLIKKIGTRKVIGGAGVLLALGYVLLSLAKSSFTCVIGMLVIGLGYGAGGLVPCSMLISNWFKEKRGLALGFAMCGSGVATLFFPELLTALIAKIGLRGTLMFNAAAIFMFVLIAWILIRDYPSDMGLLPYGADNCTMSENAVKLENEEADVPNAKKYFIIVFISNFFIGMMVSPLVTHFTPVVSQSGYSAIVAATVLSVYGAAMMIGKPLTGIIIDKIGIIKANIYIFTLTGISLIVGMLVPKNIIFAYALTIFFGLGGATILTVALPVWTSHIFGNRGMTKYFSLIKLASSLGGMIGASLPGIIFDNTGSYSKLFAIYLFFIIFSFVIIETLLVKTERDKR